MSLGDLRPTPIDPARSIPSPVVRGRSFATPDTLFTRGINAPRIRQVDTYIAWINNPSGRALLPGEPVVFAVSDRTGRGEKVNWRIRAYGEARNPSHPSWFFENEPILREFRSTLDVGQVFLLTAEDLEEGQTTVVIDVTVIDPDGRLTGVANSVFVVDRSLLSEFAIMLPDVLPAAPAELAVVISGEPTIVAPEAVLVPDLVPVTEATPAEIIEPLVVG